MMDPEILAEINDRLRAVRDDLERVNDPADRILAGVQVMLARAVSEVAFVVSVRRRHPRAPAGAARP